MSVKKVFNNNVILGVDETGRELVLIGRGLGFQTSPGDPVRTDRIERTFVPGSASAERLAAFAAEIPLAEIDAVEEVIGAARTHLGAHITDRTLLPLVDHIHFAIERARNAQRIDYPLMWEVEQLYPDEVAEGRESLRIIERRLGVRLDDAEAVPLALHFVNAQFDSGDIAATMRMTQGMATALEIIGEDFGIEIDERSMPVARFVTHLRYLFLRQRKGQGPPGLGEELREAVRTAKPREYASARKVAERLAKTFGWQVDEEEVMYLALHVTRLTVQAAQGGTS